MALRAFVEVLLQKALTAPSFVRYSKQLTGGPLYLATVHQQGVDQAFCLALLVFFSQEVIKK